MLTDCIRELCDTGAADDVATEIEAGERTFACPQRVCQRRGPVVGHTVEVEGRKR